MRFLLAPLLLLGGAGTGLATTALHHWWWGLALGAAATMTALVALPPGWWGRLAFALGWFLLVARLVLPRPEGGFVVGADTPGYALMALGLVVLVTGVATLPRPTRPVRRARS
ncbi:hypothetical protein H5V45_06245 [Nocardioides sp. KIGAM211]|uniref:Uncharacterized protein n=1 Tax=Nocardioides luti TaxID=2761101 RepID=A0A7X0RH39_9ACTN|nr:hypothetical protein [Nocardioides luti]MBB6626918.1 hypothetical protein [Nocardioides luti]